MTDDTCKEHSGCMARIQDVEENISMLWGKWDRINNVFIGSLVALILNLAGVVFLILKG